jgi:two-component system chemotaxis sensor kinase CheA
LVRPSRDLRHPLTHQRILSVSPQEFFALEGRESIAVNGHPVTVVQLSDLLDLPRAQIMRKDARIPVVAIASAERRIALAVDELAGEQETVVKNLGSQLISVGGFSGASLGRWTGDLILSIGDSSNWQCVANVRPFSRR